VTQPIVKSLKAVARQIYTSAWLESKGLPEAEIGIFDEGDGPWFVLKARSKCRYFFQAFPGLPKEARFLAETMDGIALYLIEQAHQWPDVPKKNRVHEISPGRFYLPGITPWPDNHARKEPK